MGLFSSLFGQSDAVDKYNDAMDELERASKQDRKKPDDAAWNKANDAVWAARENVPWWRR